MGMSKRHRPDHRKKKRADGQVSFSSEESDSGSDSSGGEITRSSRKRKTPKRTAIRPDERLDVGNDDLNPVQRTKDWNAHVLANLEFQRDLDLSQPDKERWDKARDEMISLRSIYNGRRRTGRDVEAMSTERQSTNLTSHPSNEKSNENVGNGSSHQGEGGEGVGLIQPKVEVNQDEDFWSFATSFCVLVLFFLESNPSKAIEEEVIQIKVEVNEDDPDCNAPAPCQNDIDDDDADYATQSQAVSGTDSVSDEVGSSLSVAPASSREGTSSEPNMTGDDQGQSKSNMPTAIRTCSALEKFHSTAPQTPSTKSGKHKRTVSEPTPNHINGDCQTPSTSHYCSLPDTSINSEDSSSNDGDNTLPNLPTYYMNRRIRILKGRKRCLTEDEFLASVIDNATNPVIAIHGPSGMGKTTFLAQMGGKILQDFQGRKLFYLEMKNVVEAVKEERKHFYKDIATWAALRRLTKESKMGEAIPNASKTELFLDGFDNIPLWDLGLVCKILRCVSSTFHSTGIRMWIATVPNDFKRIEQSLQITETYLLEPLDYSNQVELIASYLELHTSDSRSSLLKFVRKCLKDLTAKDKCDLELGNPLQCLLIGAACLSEKNSAKKCCRIQPKNILDINCSGIFENLLLDSASKCSFHTLKLIVDLNKFDINCLNSLGESPLFLSAYAKGNIDCLQKLKFLLTKDVNLDILNKSNDNLLLYAARCATVECLNYILSLNKFYINCKGNNGNTPLFLSVGGIDNVDCLEKVKLLEDKANLYHLNNDNSNLLLHSAQYASAEVFEYILSLNKFDINSEDNEGDTPLLLSVIQYKGIDCLKKLEMVIAQGGNLDHVNKQGINLLLCAAHFGSLDVLEYVINLDRFDINSVDNDGMTAFDYATTRKGNSMKAKVELLLEKGCVAEG